MAERSTNGRRDSSVMYPLMELYEESGMTQKQFCEEMDVVPHTFSYWLTKYRKSKQSKETGRKSSDFVALNISEPPKTLDSSRRIRITYPNGTLIELSV